MLLKQIISVQLKFALSAFLLVGCNSQNENLSNTVGYLTTDLDNKRMEISEFSGTVVSEMDSAGHGAVNLEVKMESENGEKIIFEIVDYKKDKIYSLKEVNNNVEWEGSPFAESSGSLRYCVSERFFFGTQASVGGGPLGNMGRTFF